MTTVPVVPNEADHVLVASPNVAFRQRILDRLPKAGRIQQVNGGAEALGHLERGLWNLLFLDRRLPDLDADELSQTVRKRYPAVEVFLVDDQGAGTTDMESNVPVAPLLPKAIMNEQQVSGVELECDCHNQRNMQRRSAGNHRLSSTEVSCDPLLPGMVGNSPSMQAVYRLVRLVGPRDTTVLITGPTGSGKELVAHAVHELSPRAARSFTVVNCAAIPESLLEAELFGYSRGAFTGALQSYAGRIQAAHMGTLFLDEIGDMPITLQPKLLRFLEQKELQRLGSSQVVRVDTRVIAATNADLLKLVREGRFREDLYYRLSSFPIKIPPLSDRPEDIALLAGYFLERLSPANLRPVLSDEAAACLLAQRWPGNVRELQNVMERALIMADGTPVIGSCHLMLADVCPTARPVDTGTHSSGEGMRLF
jgi:transcriptional regulator with GAF, ATPase, and Fis domain